MSSSSNFSSSSSGSENEESCNEETMEFSSVVPYDESLEPLATEEEAKEQEERMAEEAELEREYEARFSSQCFKMCSNTFLSLMCWVKM